MLKLNREEKKVWNIGIITLNLIIFITLTVTFLKRTNINIAFDDSYIILYFMNSVLAILALIAVKTYHSLSNSNELYILLLYFINLTLELILKFGVNCYIGDLDYKVFMGSLFLRTCLIVLLLFRKQFKKNYLLKSSKFNNLIYFCLTTTLMIYDILNLGAEVEPTYLLQIGSITIIVVTACSIFYNLKQSIEEDDILCSVISLSFVFIAVKLMYKLDNYLFRTNYNINNIVMEEILMFLALIFMVFGTIIEIYKYTIKYKLAEEKTNIYYKVIDQNTSTNILIYKNKKLIYLNKRAEKQFGNISMEEVQKKIVKTKVADGVEDLLKSVEHKVNDNKIIEGFDGKIYAVSYQNIKPLYTENKSEQVDIYMCRDITEEINSKKMLDVTDKKFNILNDHLEDVVVVTDEEFKITYINRYCEKMLGKKCNDTINTSLEEYLEIPNIKNKIEFNTKVKIKSDEEKEILVKVEELKDYDGRVVGYIFICSKKVLDGAFDEDGISERKLLKKDAFTNLSHELRTPIHIIYSSLQLLNSQKDILTQENFIESFERYEGVMKINSLRLLKLVNDIVDISKLDTGAIKLNKNMYNIVSLVENISMSVIPYMKVKNINFIFDTNEEERFICCDQEKIERIVLNLISNAIKFTPENGSVDVFVDVADEYVKIKVKDNGIGIEKDKCNEIFKRFVQCENGSITSKGSGIGLSLVKSLVEMHNGYVYVESEFGKGSEFIVCLPNSSEEDNENALISGENLDMALLGDISVEFSNIDC